MPPDDETIIAPQLYAIAKEIGFEHDTDEMDALRAAFALGQKYFRDAAIERLGDFDAVKCAQVVASIPICSGYLRISTPKGKP